MTRASPRVEVEDEAWHPLRIAGLLCCQISTTPSAADCYLTSSPLIPTLIQARSPLTPPPAISLGSLSDLLVDSTTPADPRRPTAHACIGVLYTPSLSPSARHQWFSSQRPSSLSTLHPCESIVPSINPADPRHVRRACFHGRACTETLRPPFCWVLRCQGGQNLLQPPRAQEKGQKKKWAAAGGVGGESWHCGLFR